MKRARIEIGFGSSSADPWRHLVAVVEGVPGDEIQRILTAQRRKAAAGGQYGYSQSVADYAFYEMGENDYVMFTPGLRWRVAEQLAEAGWQVEMVDRRAIDSQSNQPEQGQIIVNDWKEGFVWLRNACAAFGNKSVLLVARNNWERKWLKRNLPRQKGRLMTCDADKAWHTRRRTVIEGMGTFGGLNPNDWDFIVFFGTQPILSQEGQRGLSLCREWRYDDGMPPHMFCIHDGRQLSRWEELMVEQACGPVIYDARGETGQDLPIPKVKVLEYVADSQGDHPKTESVFERKCRRIWHNHQRNKLVVTAARALAQCDLTTLADLNIADLPTGSVAIIVESPDHGRVLRGLLPEWRLLTLAPDAAGYVGGQPVGHQTIATEYYLSQSLVTAQVVVRATCGRSDLLVRWGNDGDSTEHKMGLLDFGEIRDNRVDRDTQARMAAYAQRTWPVGLSVLKDRG